MFGSSGAGGDEGAGDTAAFGLGCVAGFGDFFFAAAETDAAGAPDGAGATASGAALGWGVVVVGGGGGGGRLSAVGDDVSASASDIVLRALASGMAYFSATNEAPPTTRPMKRMRPMPDPVFFSAPLR